MEGHQHEGRTACSSITDSSSCGWMMTAWQETAQQPVTYDASCHFGSMQARAFARLLPARISSTTTFEWLYSTLPSFPFKPFTSTAFHIGKPFALDACYRCGKDYHEGIAHGTPSSSTAAAVALQAEGFKAIGCALSKYTQTYT